MTFSQCIQYSLILLFLGVKFASSTKEFTVAIPGKGNAIFDMEKKVVNKHERCYDIIFVSGNGI